eukprot:Sspe_Gene.92141::Locus_63936_Transcript_1_1_Confidence_1.000_Length_1102::g.92141::m.92141
MADPVQLERVRAHWRDREIERLQSVTSHEAERFFSRRCPVPICGPEERRTSPVRRTPPPTPPSLPAPQTDPSPSTTPHSTSLQTARHRLLATPAESDASTAGKVTSPSSTRHPPIPSVSSPRLIPPNSPPPGRAVRHPPRSTPLFTPSLPAQPPDALPVASPVPTYITLASPPPAFPAFGVHVAAPPPPVAQPVQLSSPSPATPDPPQPVKGRNGWKRAWEELAKRCSTDA